MNSESTRSSVLASLVIHAVILGLFAVLMVVFKRPDPGPEPIDVVFYQPGEYIPPPPAPVLPDPQPEPEPEPEPEPVVEVAKATPVPTPRVEPAPQPVEEIQVAKLQPAPEPKPRPVPVQPKRPRREVKTNLLNAAITKPATKMPTRERKTSTGSFGEAETTDAPTRSRLRGGTQVGNFAVADTPQQEKTPRRDVVKTSGFGAADSAQAPSGRQGAGSGNVTTGGFGSTAAKPRPRSSRKVQTEAPDTPVDILSKPTPVYTAEARELRVQGEVALRVTFLASGQVKVLEVLNALGHGLDEAASDAAKRIRFKPARRDGSPVDHTAVIRIVFQLV